VMDEHYSNFVCNFVTKPVSLSMIYKR
jgi:hypothetical protein